MSGKSLIRFQAADIGYGRNLILKAITCDIEEGDQVGLVGPNGSGKTTFLRAVLGRLSPASGTVQVDSGRRFSYVPQAENLNSLLPLTVREVVALAWKSRTAFGRLPPAGRAAIAAAMERAGVADIADRLLREVSGGQRQRAILAQALSRDPDVLLLDEPTRGLDVVAERDFLQLIADLRAKSRLTVLLVTHSLEISLNFMRKILLFNAGQVIATDPGEILRTRKLEQIYGIPFTVHEWQGLRWAVPARGRQ